MHIKILLKQIRKEKNITLDELSKISGISKSHLNYIEKGERRATIDVLCQIAISLKIDEKKLYKIYY